MSQPRQDIICTHCAHVRLLAAIVDAWKRNSARDLRALVEEAQRAGFGAEHQDGGK